MQNVWVRLNAVVFFALSVLLSAAIMCAFSTFMHTGVADLRTLRVNHIKTLRNHASVDRALLTFDVHADLRPAFHWNLKQLFVYVLAEYESDKNVLNQCVLWDKIVETEEDAMLKMRKQAVKYALIDQGAELRNKTIRLSLHWDHMPLTGRLYSDSRQGSEYKLPGQYVLKDIAKQ